MAVELRNAIAGALERTLPATLLFKHPTIESLAAFVVSPLGLDEEAAPRPVPDAPPPRWRTSDEEAKALPRGTGIARDVDGGRELIGGPGHRVRVLGCSEVRPRRDHDNDQTDAYAGALRWRSVAPSRSVPSRSGAVAPNIILIMVTT